MLHTFFLPQETCGVHGEWLDISHVWLLWSLWATCNMDVENQYLHSKLTAAFVNCSIDCGYKYHRMCGYSERFCNTDGITQSVLSCSLWSTLAFEAFCQILALSTITRSENSTMPKYWLQVHTCSPAHALRVHVARKAPSQSASVRECNNLIAHVSSCDYRLTPWRARKWLPLCGTFDAPYRQ